MINNSNNEKKENLIEKIKDYLLIGFFILFVACFVIFMEYSKTLINHNQENSTNSASAISCVDVTPYDTISDLTGTSWLFNSVISNNSDFSYSISFTCGVDNFSLLKLLAVGYPNPSSEINLYYNDTQVFVYAPGAPGWFNDNYRYINITGGTDITNNNLISWLQSNATQVQSGYSSTINLTNCTCNKSSESGISGSYTATITANTGYVLTNVNSSLGTVTYSNDNKVATISISDVTEDFTISATASLIYHNISYNLGNVVVTSNKPMQIDEVSTISITFQPYNNYVLPHYINVEGVTSYQWNYETGVLSLTNAFDDVVISINAEYKSGNYSFVELIDSVTLVPINTFFNLFDFEIFGVNIYSMLLSALVLFVIIKVVLKVFK